MFKAPQSPTHADEEPFFKKISSPSSEETLDIFLKGMYNIYGLVRLLERVHEPALGPGIAVTNCKKRGKYVV
jgi:hypothetical protein